MSSRWPPEGQLRRRMDRCRTRRSPRLCLPRCAPPHLL